MGDLLSPGWSFKCACGRTLTKIDPEQTVRCTCSRVWGPEDAEELETVKHRRKR